MTDADPLHAVRMRYERFAREEAPGRSFLYEEWAAGVAGDADVAGVLARITDTHRQPPLVFAVSRMLGAPEAGFAEWAQWVQDHADALVAECEARRLQSNEPLRCALLMPVLAAIDGPIALLELGASAGLCLYPDRYSYRYETDDGIRSLDPEDGPSGVVLASRWEGACSPPERLPQVVWRAGIDLAPLDPTTPETAAWLRVLVWPGETDRRERIDAALRVAAADPPTLVAGDVTEPGLLTAVAAHAPSDATLVVSTPGVFPHIPGRLRPGVVAEAQSLGRWLTIDPSTAHDVFRDHGEDRPSQGFVLAVDGELRAVVDPLGAWARWRAPHDMTTGERRGSALSERERAMLGVEARGVRHRGEKEEAIRTELGLTPARYYQLLDRLIDNPEALAADPLLIARLRRIRDDREQRRRQRRSGRE